MTRAAGLFALLFAQLLFNNSALAVIRDGGVDPSNLGKGDWIYFMSDATNKLGGNVASVTNENSLMLYYKSQGIRYIIVKAATSSNLFNGTYSSPQFTSSLVNIAHANGILIFGYNRSYGQDINAEIGISDYVFNQGADGFIWDAESEWESSSPWIGATGPSKAWQLCSTVRSNWPTKFLAHSPFAIISLHSSFPYKEFGYWCDAAMPQIYHFSTSGIKSSVSAAINWSDVNWHNWQNSLAGIPNTNINGLTVVWTNAIKPIVPIQDVYGPHTTQSLAGGTATPLPDIDVAEFIDYLSCYRDPASAGGYKGANFFRTDLHGAVQWANISAGTIGNFSNAVNNFVLDDPAASTVGSWSAVRTFYNGSYFGNGVDTNSFGTNYLAKGQGNGSAYVQFTPAIVTSGYYNIYEWHPQRSDASSNVPIIINFTGGSTNIGLNQQINAGSWNFLGQYFFASGTSGNARVTDAIPEPTAMVTADAIKFSYVFSPTPAVISAIATTNLSSNSVTITWNTDLASDSAILFGPSTNYTSTVSNSTQLITHSLTLTGLAPGNTYHYAVASTVPNAQQSISSDLTFSTPPAGVSATLIIDNPNASITGTWSTGTSSPDKFGADYRFKNGGNGSSYVQFAPTILAPAQYRVYEWHPQGSNRTTNAPYVINYTGGSQTIGLNQQVNGGKWNFLGTFYFAAGTSENVRVTDAFPDSAHVVIADAIQFLYDSPLPTLGAQLTPLPDGNRALTLFFSPFVAGHSYQVQQTDSLFPALWTNVTNVPFTMDAQGRGVVVISNLSTGTKFLRLSMQSE